VKLNYDRALSSSKNQKRKDLEFRNRRLVSSQPQHGRCIS